MYSPLSALFMLRTAQNLPHMEQLSSCSGRAVFRGWRCAVSGSMEHSHCFSQSKVLPRVGHGVVQIPRVGHFFGDVRRVRRDAARR